MQPVTDWKGNVIKEGDEVTIILVTNRGYTHNFGIWMPRSDYGYDKEYWEPGEWLKVSNKDGVLGCFRDVRVWENGINNTTEWSTAHTFMTLSMMLPSQKTCIIAIKGISDNEEEYRNFT